MQTLLHDVETFLSSHPEIAPTRFGAEALRDRHFVRTLREGRRVWPETEAKVRSFMEKHAPALCAECEIRSEDHRVRSCTSPQCPLRARNAA